MITEAAGNEIALDETAQERELPGLPLRAERRRVLICDTQPVAVEGMKWLIENSGDLEVAASVSSLGEVTERLHPGTARVAEALAALAARSAEADGETVEFPALATMTAESASTESALPEVSSLSAGEPAKGTIEPGEPVRLDAVETAPESLASGSPVTAEPLAPEHYDAIVIDKGFGMADVMELLHRHTAQSHPTPIVVWGAISEPEALRLLQAGARGILRRTSESEKLLTCLRTVTTGGAWMEDGIFGSKDKLFNPKRSQLTQREREVVLLVEKGLRNRDIAEILGIQTGTVKIHLKHIFEKTGVRGRYGLAFTGLQNKGSIAVAPPPRHYAA